MLSATRYKKYINIYNFLRSLPRCGFSNRGLGLGIEKSISRLYWFGEFKSMSFNESLRDTVRNNFCTILSSINEFNDYFNRLPFGESNLSAGIARYAYRNLCNREPPSLPDPLVPGGQCVGVGYKWQVSFEWSGNAYDNNWLSETISNFAQPNTSGPIGELRKVGGAGNWSLRFNSGSGEVVVFSHTSGSSTGFRNYRFTQIYRADGQPDNCGVVPSPVPPPSPGYTTQDITVTYNDYSNNPIDVDATLIIGSPQLTFNGDINIPVRINSPDITIPISGRISVNNPEFNFDFSDSNFNTTNNTYNGSDYDTPEPPPDIPPDVPCPVQPTNPSEPDLETVRTIRAVIVTVTDVSDNETVIFQSGNPDIYAPNFGYVNFLCQIGSSLAWSVDIGVKNRRNLIVCPWEGGAIQVDGTPRSGVSWTLTEVYAKEDQTVTYEV